MEAVAHPPVQALSAQRAWAQAQVEAVAHPPVRIPLARLAWPQVQEEEIKEINPRTSCRRPTCLPMKNVNYVTVQVVIVSGSSLSGFPFKEIVPSARRACGLVHSLIAFGGRGRPLAGPLPLRKLGLVVGRSRPIAR